MEFQIILNHVDFSGPFDVLLGLIERKRIPLSEISIITIIDDYINFLEKNYENIPKESVAEFISLASNLVYIKSQYLLPQSLKPDEGEVLLKNLELRLLLLTNLRSVSKKYDLNGHKLLMRLYIKKENIQIPFSIKDHHYDSIFFENLASFVLRRTMQRIKESKEKVLPHIIIERTVSMPEIISFWEQTFESEACKELLFYEQFKKLLHRFEINNDYVKFPNVLKKNLCAHFLSILELSRNHGVILNQVYEFGDIIITKE